MPADFVIIGNSWMFIWKFEMKMEYRNFWDRLEIGIGINGYIIGPLLRLIRFHITRINFETGIREDNTEIPFA